MNIRILDGVVSLAEVSKAIPPDITVYSAARSTIEEGCYLEVSYVHGNSRSRGSLCIVLYRCFDREIPDNVVLHGLKQRDGSFVYVFLVLAIIQKKIKLFGRDLDELEQKLGVRLWKIPRIV